jgi:5-methyltetrahydrofolate--homocysteine methyltransferase
MREIFFRCNLIPKLRERLSTPDVLVSDGAIGTMLLPYLQTGEPPEIINLKQPEILEKIARLYLNAGADFIQTNTFGASPLKLALYGLDNKTEEINVSAVQAVRRAIGSKEYISASCGPTGKILEPYGDTKEELVFETFKRQMKVLIGEGVDMISIETMIDINEVKLAIQAVRSISTEIPVSASMTFDQTPKGFFTVMGVSIKQAAEELAKAGADIIGSNCGNGIQNMIMIASEFKRHTSLPIIIQSNAGIPVLKGETSIYPETPEFFAEGSKVLAEAGVRIIGGCCGTTSEHISSIRKVVDSHNKNLWHN